MPGDDDESPSNLPSLLVVLVVLVAMGGCVWWFFIRAAPEGGDVTGTVTLDNQPLAGATVVFVGQDEKNQAPIPTMTNENGVYRLIGNANRRIPLGKYKIAVSKVALPDGTLPQGEELEQARANGLLRNLLPKIYEENGTTPLEAEIRSGANVVNLELKKIP